MTTTGGRAGRLRIAVLASGRGSNLQAILDAIDAGTLDAEVAGVFSDKPDAVALQRARDAGLHAESLRAKGFASREAFDDAFFASVDAVRPDLIVCAGYMRIIGAAAVEARAGRMINIHPSLLPLFKGLHTHRQALDAGVAEHGASVHFVTPISMAARSSRKPACRCCRATTRMRSRHASSPANTRCCSRCCAGSRLVGSPCMNDPFTLTAPPCPTRFSLSQPRLRMMCAA